MIERALIVAALAGVAILVYYAFRAFHLRRMERGPAGMPALLYFRADSCAVCPAQGRIIDQLAGQWAGRIDIRTIDAEREPETAARYRVLSLPTTILVDADGHVQHINYGLADAAKLSRQIAMVAGTQAEPITISQVAAAKSVPTD